MKEVDEKLKVYVETNILPLYSLNDGAHNLDHIFYVLDRSFRFSEKCHENLDSNMIYIIAVYHDVGHHIDAKNHEKLSADFLENDINLRSFFTEDQIVIMKQAIEDHRASLEYEPRSIYGKIISSADRNTSVDITLKRTYEYRRKHFPSLTIEEIIEDSMKHIVNKFGRSGYATKKIYFEDLEYYSFLEEVKDLLKDKTEFETRFKKVNNII